MVWDLSALLALLAVAAGMIVLADRRWWKPRRAQGTRVPLLVDYAHALFPVLAVLFLFRSFVYEPYRIPSDSMMPTLRDGDFIVVSKFEYGWRLPLFNVALSPQRAPARGDVVVFHPPQHRAQTYIKRLVGLPGDRIAVRGDAVWINGELASAHPTGAFSDDACYAGFTQGLEVLGGHEHALMVCAGEPGPFACGRRTGVRCEGPPRQAPPLQGATRDWTGVVPPDAFFFLGDNRDNSQDSRYRELGFVPRANVVGRATWVWLNIGNGTGPQWSRVGTRIR